MANRQNTGGTEGGATEGAQNGTGVSTLTGPSLRTTGLKTRHYVLLYFILVHLY